MQSLLTKNKNLLFWQCKNHATSIFVPFKGMSLKITQPRLFSFCKKNFFHLYLQILQRVVTLALNAYRPSESQRRPVDQLILFKISFGCSYDPDHDFMDD
jgi:hypothetical protein